MLKKRMFRLDPTQVVPNGGNGYYPADIRKAYNIPNDLQGEGQTIGILEFSNGYNIQDAVDFWNSHGITPPQVEFVSIDGTPNDDGANGWDAECALDLQWAGAIAPKAKIVVYEADAGQTYADFGQAMLKTLKYILNDTQHKPTVLSISYGDAEDTFGSDIINQWADVIQQLDAKGVTVCISSGDQGAYGMHDTNGQKTRHADAPATAPFAVAIGGTALYLDGKETAWSYNTQNDGGATGGGFSKVFTQPDYQTNLPAAKGMGRGIPDISFDADPATGYEIVFQGQRFPIGGTSVACPVFAAIVALANERRALNNKTSITGLTKWLYENADKGFVKVVTEGNNNFNGVVGFNSTAAWNACTGIGTMDVSKFVDLIGGPSPTPSPVVPTPTNFWANIFNVFVVIFKMIFHIK